MDLGRAQFLSLCTKAVTTGLGIVQSILVIRILSPAEYGVVGLVMSIGGLIGVSQHLGIVDGAIREIAVLRERREIAKVFWVSHAVRQAVTLPLSLGLVAAAYYIAVHIYQRPEIVPLIQLYAAVLVLQGMQDVLGATLTGMKHFVALYLVQIITAAFNIAAFGYLTYAYGTVGFFWAVILTTSVMVLLFAALIARYLAGSLAPPSRAAVVHYGRRVMRIGAFMYLSRIFFVVWQRLPLLLLGAVLTAEELGYLNVSLTFGSRLTIIAMALSEVNLAWMSTLFAQEQQKFREVVTRNMHRVLVVMTLISLVLLFFTPEILRYIIGAEYAPAQHLIVIMTAAFFLYALVDIGTSSIFVSADTPRDRATVYGLMTAVSGAVILYLLWENPEPLAASLAVLLGAAVAFIAMTLHAHRKFRISLLTPQLALFLAALGASVVWFFTNPAFAPRLIVFVALTAYIVFEAHRSQLLPHTLFFWKKKNLEGEKLNIICFAGAAYHQLSWTNRQHMMSRIARTHRVLYIEPRVWILRFFFQHVTRPRTLLAFLQRLLWIQREHDNLYVKAQWNLIPGSREFGVVSTLNHWLNRWGVLSWARWLGFRQHRPVVWLYDTEAAEYLDAFPRATVLYDCVDDHASQAGADRNPARVRHEEAHILRRADVVTVTSKKLFELKRGANPNTHLVLNSGDVELFSKPRSAPPRTEAYRQLAALPHPRFGSVGALDFYKLDDELIAQVARRRPDWHFVFIGQSVVSDKNNRSIHTLAELPNVHLLGAVFHQEVPTYVAEFDVCLIPYRTNQYNAASFPLKFWEFMATGKPIVVSGVPELTAYNDYIEYVRNADEFILQGEKCLSAPERNADERKELAQQHTWDARVEKVMALLLRARRTADAHMSAREAVHYD